MTHSFAFFPCLWVTCVLSLCGGISVFRGFEACSPPLPTPQRHSPLPPQQHRAFCWRNVGSSRWGGGSPCHQRGAAVAQDRGLSWRQASSPRVALNLHINLHKTLIGDKCTCFFIYGALQVYTEISFEQKKKKKIKLPASALCRIKAKWGLGPSAPTVCHWPHAPLRWGFGSLNSLPALSPIVGLPPSVPVWRSRAREAWLFQSSFTADPAPRLLICMQPALLLCALVMELHTVAQRPSECLPPSLTWYTAAVGSMGSLLEDKINFWVMHVGRNNLNETRTLLGYKLTVTTEEKRYGHHRAQLLANLFVLYYSVRCRMETK